MKISELICRLQSVKCEHGDLPVAVYTDHFFLLEAKEVRLKSLVKYDEARLKAVEMWRGERHVVVF